MSPQSKRKNNINAKGRSRYDNSQYLKLPYNLIKSPQFRSLKGNAVRVLLEIASRHNGYNNGHIGVGLEDLVQTLGMGKSTVQRCLQELQKIKFIILRKPGKFQGRIASEWEVTFLSTDERQASNEWGQVKALPYKRKPKSKTLAQESYEEIECQKAKN